MARILCKFWNYDMYFWKRLKELETSAWKRDAWGGSDSCFHMFERILYIRWSRLFDVSQWMKDADKPFP